MGDQVSQRGHRDDVQVAEQRGLGGVLGRHEDLLQARGARRGDHGQDAMDVAQTTVEPELTQKHGSAFGLFDLAGGDQNRQRERQIVRRAVLGQFCRREIDGDPP